MRLIKMWFKKINKIRQFKMLAHNMQLMRDLSLLNLNRKN